jgi:uracil-DNA glycosylase
MREIINQVIETLEHDEMLFLEKVLSDKTLIPRREDVFNGFNLPSQDVKYIIFGESPYPRIESATGHAFIDGKVKEIWGEEGLSKEVNKATSLRNLFKTALVADNIISPEKTTKAYIKNIDTTGFVNTMGGYKKISTIMVLR